MKKVKIVLELPVPDGFLDLDLKEAKEKMACQLSVFEDFISSIDMMNENGEEVRFLVSVKKYDEIEMINPFESSPIDVDFDEAQTYIGKKGVGILAKDQPVEMYRVTFYDGAVGLFYRQELEFHGKI